MADFEPKVVCFSCNFGWGYLIQNQERFKNIKRLIPVICSGKIDTAHIIDVFKGGADGVLILGCPDGDCHFHNGNYQARKKMSLLRKTLESFGIEPQRLRMEFGSDPAGERINVLMQQMCDDLRSLGPIAPHC